MIDESDPALNLFVILSSLAKISEIDCSKKIQEELDIFSLMINDIGEKMTEKLIEEIISYKLFIKRGL